MPQHRRTQARRLALQALCILESVGDAFAPELDHFLRDPVHLVDLGIEPPLHHETLAFAAELARGAWRQRRRTDALLQKLSENWSLKRMTPVTRNVLRLGAFELAESRDTDPKVVLDQAIELAQLFADGEAAAFVNGVLDAVRRELMIPIDRPSHAAPAGPVAPPASQEQDAHGTV